MAPGWRQPKRKREIQELTKGNGRAVDKKITPNVLSLASPRTEVCLKKANPLEWKNSGSTLEGSHVQATPIQPYAEDFLATGWCHDKLKTWKSIHFDGLAEQATSSRDLKTTGLLFYLSSGAFSRLNICCRCKRFNLSAIKLLARVGRMDVDWMPLRRANWEGPLGARSECTARCFMTRRQRDYWCDPSCIGLRCIGKDWYQRVHTRWTAAFSCISQSAEGSSHKSPAKSKDTHSQLDTSVCIANWTSQRDTLKSVVSITQRPAHLSVSHRDTWGHRAGCIRMCSCRGWGAPRMWVFCKDRHFVRLIS